MTANRPSAGRHRLLRLSLGLARMTHPRRRRDADGYEMVETAVAAYRARLLTAGRWAAAVLGVRMTLDVMTSGFHERAAARREEEGKTMGRWIDVWTDVRVAARSLRKSPGFTLAAIVVLALGIGVNTALFSAVRATLLADPPYPDHERLVLLHLTDSSTVQPGAARHFPWSYPKFGLLAGMDLPVDAAAAYARRNLTLTGVGDAALVAVEFITPAYLDILGAVPAVGRGFTEGDDVEGAPPVVVLAHALWQDRFGADPEVVGRDVVLNGRSVRVVGVAPAGFRGLTGDASAWVPVHTGAALTAAFLVRAAQAHWLTAIARVRPGTDPAVLAARMEDAGRAAEEAWPTTDPTVVRGGAAQPFAEALVNPQARTSLLVLGAAALLLLLVACANLASLLLARANARTREAAVRVALGAGRWRVARTFLAEALLLAGVGGAAGIALASPALSALAALWPGRFLNGSWNVRAAGVDAVGLDPWVLAFGAAAALGTGLLFGLLPALGVGQGDPAARLRGGADAGARAGRPWDARGLLVGAEMGMALVLLVGAGLLLRSLDELQTVERGFEPDGLISLSFAIPRGSVWADEPAAFNERFLERLRGLPGVEHAGLSCAPPLSGHCMIGAVREAGASSWTEGSRPGIGIHYVSDDLFATLGVPVLHGRTFTSADRQDTGPVVVLSQAAALELFPDGSPLGQTVSLTLDLTPEGGPGAEVIGVVGDVLYDRPANGVMPEAYVSHRQSEGPSTVLIRARGEPLAVVPAVRAALAELDPNVPLHNVRTIQDLEANASGDTRVLGTLLTAFAALALLLACTGVWSVVAYAVSRRTREIGVRVALGADSGRVVRQMLGRGLVLSVGGLVIGVVAAWASSRVLGALLFGVGTTDPMAFAGAAGVLLLVATLASWLPARRAARVDPMVALRND